MFGFSQFFSKNTFVSHTTLALISSLFNVELDIEVTDKATRGAVAGKVRVLSAAQVELELDAGDGYKPRDLWLAQAAVSGCLFC
jgi:hypothetical protein